MKHTPEPWSAATRGPNGCPIIGHKGLMVAMLAHSSLDKDHGEVADANEQRIVACVNACAGINPEAIKPMIDALTEWKKIRDLDKKSDLDVTATDWWKEQLDDKIEAVITLAKEGLE